MDSGEQNERTAEGPVEVARAGDLFEARLLVGYLDAHGIPAHIPGEAMMGVMDGAAVIWSEGVRVEVAAGHAEEARRLLTEREERRPDADADESEA